MNQSRRPGQGREFLLPVLGDFPSKSFPTVFFDDVVHDIGWRVIDASGLQYFWFGLNLYLPRRCDANHLAKDCS